MRFIPARYSGPRRLATPLTIRWIVIHTMEIDEKPDVAMGVAALFNGPHSPKASMHYCIDANEVVQTVPESVVAWCAPGANRYGIHLEHAGWARQTGEEWDDAFTRAMLRRSASLARIIADRYEIPLVRLSPADLLEGKRGFCGHVDAANAFERTNPKRHWDPGPHFPWDHYLMLVQTAPFSRPPVNAA